jgi:hypothetical protein
MNEAEKEFAKGIEQKELMRRRESVLAREATTNLLHDSQEQSAKALDKQAEVFQETLGRQIISDNEKIDTLQKSLRNQRTSQTLDAVSPAVESIVRKSVIKEYEKNFSAERDRNKASYEYLQNAATNKLRDVQTEYETEKTNESRQIATERHEERQELLNQFQEADLLKESALRSKEKDNERERDLLMRHYETMLERQKREFESMIETQRSAGYNRLATQRQEKDFNYKMAIRNASIRENELVHEYERKLSDQKSTYDLRLDEMKAQTQQELRNEQRRNQLALDSLQKASEQRISQIQAQNAERERSLSQNFQEEIERIKHTNALLLQKKG